MKSCKSCGAPLVAGAPKCPECEALVRLPVCRVCRLPMPPRASKCTECDAYQAWWRIGLSGELVAALSALITTSFALWALLQGQFTRQYSETSLVKVQRQESTSVLVLVRNVGNQPAYLIDGHVELTSAQGVLGGELTVEQPADRRVPAQHLVPVTLKRGGWQRRLRMPAGGERDLVPAEVRALVDGSRCTLRLGVAEYGDAEPASSGADEPSIDCTGILTDFAVNALGG